MNRSIARACACVVREREREAGRGTLDRSYVPEIQASLGSRSLSIDTRALIHTFYVERFTVIEAEVRQLLAGSGSGSLSSKRPRKEGRRKANFQTPFSRVRLTRFSHDQPIESLTDRSSEQIYMRTCGHVDRVRSFPLCKCEDEIPRIVRARVNVNPRGERADGDLYSRRVISRKRELFLEGIPRRPFAGRYHFSFCPLQIFHANTIYSFVSFRESSDQHFS